MANYNDLPSTYVSRRRAVSLTLATTGFILLILVIPQLDKLPNNAIIALAWGSN